MVIFTLFFSYLLFKSYLFQKIKNLSFQSPEKKKLKKDLKAVYNEGAFNSVFAIQWLYRYRDYYYPNLKGDSSLALFKDYAKMNDALCRAIEKLESGQYGKDNLTIEDQNFIFQELNKLCDQGARK